MKRTIENAIFLFAITILVAMADCWIYENLLGMMRAFRNMDIGDNDPEPGRHHLAWALFVVNAPIAMGWIAFCAGSRNSGNAVNPPSH